MDFYYIPRKIPLFIGNLEMLIEATVPLLKATGTTIYFLLSVSDSHISPYDKAIYYYSFYYKCSNDPGATLKKEIFLS